MHTTISIKTTSEIKTKAQKVAESLGMNLTGVIDRYLKTFIKTKGEDIREEPTEYLLKSLKESEEDVKAGRVVSFKNPQDAIHYIDTLIKNDPEYKKN